MHHEKHPLHQTRAAKGKMDVDPCSRTYPHRAARTNECLLAHRQPANLPCSSRRRSWLAEGALAPKEGSSCVVLAICVSRHRHRHQPASVRDRDRAASVGPGCGTPTAQCTHTRRTPIRLSQRHTANIRHAAPPPTCAAPNRRLADKKNRVPPRFASRVRIRPDHCADISSSLFPSSSTDKFRTHLSPSYANPPSWEFELADSSRAPSSGLRPSSACMTPRSGTREESPPTHESRRRASTSRGWAGSSSSLLPRPKIQGRPPLTPALAEHVHVHVHVHR